MNSPSLKNNNTTNQEIRCIEQKLHVHFLNFPEEENKGEKEIRRRKLMQKSFRREGRAILTVIKFDKIRSLTSGTKVS
jgi:hypothetical protein